MLLPKSDWWFVAQQYMMGSLCQFATRTVKLATERGPLRAWLHCQINAGLLGRSSISLLS